MQNSFKYVPKEHLVLIGWHDVKTTGMDICKKENATAKKMNITIMSMDVQVFLLILETQFICELILSISLRNQWWFLKTCYYYWLELSIVYGKSLNWTVILEYAQMLAKLSSLHLNGNINKTHLP